MKKYIFGPARRWASALALGASLLAPVAHASPLYTQAFDPAGYLYLSISSAQNAESFQLGYAASLTSLSFFGSDIDTASLVVRLYAGDVATSPDTYTLMAGTMTRSASLFQIPAGLDIYEYTLTLDTAYLTSANQQYYLAAFATGQTGNWAWISSTVGDNSSAYRNGDGSVWNKSAPDLAISIGGDRIINETPEPASVALVCLALCAAGLARRRSA